MESAVGDPAGSGRCACPGEVGAARRCDGRLDHRGVAGLLLPHMERGRREVRLLDWEERLD